MRHSSVKDFTLLLVSILLVLGISEIALRAILPPLPSGWGWSDSPRRSLSTIQNDFGNEFGLRGQNFKYENNDYIILLLGDSQVEAATSSPDNMPERLLEKHLSPLLQRPVKVFSLAASGWGQDQQLIALENYYKNKKRADLVLIWATPGNDFWENAFPDRSISGRAGHLKPTYRLSRENNIEGPFFKPNNYLKNSALFQLISNTIHNKNGKLLEDHILEEWTKKLPLPHKTIDGISGSICHNTTKVAQKTFYKNIFELNDRDVVTLETSEDFLNSRSHFSPYSVERSERDIYLVKITKKLYERIEEVAESNGSFFSVIYPIREDIDIRGNKFIKCIKINSIPDRVYPVELDYLSVLKEVVSEERLFSFKLTGENELSVSSEDRHLSDLGNDQAMRKVATFINQYIQ